MDSEKGGGGMEGEKWEGMIGGERGEGWMGRDEGGRMGRDEGGRMGRDGGEMEWGGVKEGGGAEPLTWARRRLCPFMRTRRRS